MIQVISELIRQPGVLLGLGLGVCIGFIARGQFLNSIFEEDWDEDRFLQLDGDSDVKLVILVRTDLKMGKGKVAAQCCHATLKAYKQIKKIDPELLRIWEMKGQPKVVLKVEDEDSLLNLASVARNQGLTTSMIQDAGRTQIAPGSRTVLGIGPGSSKLIDNVSGHLKLY